MLATRTLKPFLIIPALLTVYFALSANVEAQVWLPPKGEGSVTLTYQKVDVRNHYNSVGTKADTGHIHTHNAVMALEYGLTNRLALDFDLTFVSSKYQGLRPHGPPDTGSFHPMFQDLHINLRYNALRGPLMVTPFVGITLPTHDYPLRGHSAVGRGFKEFLVGINVGRPMFRKAYVQVGYSFAMHKRFAGLNLNRSNVDCEVGWVASRLITLRFIALFQKTHGGFQFPEDIHDPANFEFHDRVARANFVQLGGGATFALNKRISILAAYAPVPIYARNTHGDKGIVIGLSWRFSRESSSGRIARSTSPSKLPTPGTGMF